MATIKDISMRGYCDTVYLELSDIRSRILELTDKIEKTYGVEDEVFKAHSRHLHELADFVEWKLQLITKVCPHDWKGFGEEVESMVSVPVQERLKETEVSGGYIGG
jgi:hypothetical protein